MSNAIPHYPTQAEETSNAIPPYPTQAEELTSRFKAWRNTCKKHEQYHCATCPIDNICRGVGMHPSCFSDGDINTMVRRFLHLERKQAHSD